MHKQVEQPRLTSFIRAHGCVSAPGSENTAYDPHLLKRKKLEIAEKEEKWKNSSMVKEYLMKFSTLHPDEIRDLLSDLFMLAKDIAGSDVPADFIEYTIVYLIELLRNTIFISKEQKLELKKRFGNFSEKSINRVLLLVKKVSESLSPAVSEDFIKKGFPQPTEDLLEQPFGAKFKFNHQVPLDKSFCIVPVDSSMKEKKSALKEWSFKYVPPPPSSSKPEVPKEPKIASFVKNKFDQHWLFESVTQSLKDCSPTDLCISVISMLKSAQSDEVLQNELLDLLGCNCFDLVQTILQHRKDIIDSKTYQPNSVNMPSKKTQSVPYGSQVVIQSETEKQIAKQIRRDEKRIQRDKERGKEEDVFYFNQQKMVQNREQQLLIAQNKPIFPQPSMRMRSSVSSSPHVYDSYSSVKMTASYVSGRKLCLPENAERKNNSIFEEIFIPQISSTDPLLKKFERLNIEDQEEIIKVGFKGFKSLNGIQSTVFKTAFYTNENLLFCAPTGAGKTNVAMLTVLREIKNNIVDNVFNKNAFKIVYIAPMKALAAEMVRNFSLRLKELGSIKGLEGIKVKELTGDMQLTKKEITETQMIVTTPEKWDVVTRKSTGDIGLSQLVRLLIIDEVHLLDSDRGPVLEALVARTLRQVVISQTMIRIIGLSATLPNYRDVATFLNVDHNNGLFFFDDRFRPVPLSPTFIGVKTTNPFQSSQDMDRICYEKIERLVPEHQVMVFVHARNATVKTAAILKEMASQYDSLHLFSKNDNSLTHGITRNKQLKELIEYGFGFHHAGMLRSDRNIVEKLFEKGSLKVLVCTSTLAWGVNLPARAVIIKGTEVYDSNKGNFMDLNVLDVMQIFGRAGRPQYDKKGEGIIITTHNKLSHYLSLLTRQHQIESKFGDCLADHLNAEIALGSVTNVTEAVEWLKYTYLYVRMQANPLAYGLKSSLTIGDPGLIKCLTVLIEKAAIMLDKAHMIRFDPNNGFLNITDMGRSASHYYINTESITRFNEKLSANLFHCTEVLSIISLAQEFDQLKVRDEEAIELDYLLHECVFDVPMGSENREGKVNILLQAYISKINIKEFSLISDQGYIIKNATRIIRALFEVCLRKTWAFPTALFLKFAKMVERRMWGPDCHKHQSPLHQFSELSLDVLSKIDRLNIDMDTLKELPEDELGARTRCYKDRRIIKRCLEYIPNLSIIPVVQPITSSILRVTLDIYPEFQWCDKYHGLGFEMFWIWISDPESDEIYHSEYFMLPKKQVIHEEKQTLIFTIPLSSDSRPSQYLIRVVSDRWLGSDREFCMPFKNLILPHHHQPHTELLELIPLPVQALKNKNFEELYKFEFFNPIQTQIFHTLYHTDHNVLLGAPTGSGKTIAAEIAMFRVFNVYPGTKIVYIAPLKALVRERIEDWKKRFHGQLGKNIVELTGDVTPDAAAIATADIIVTTPEKWDGVSRSWQTRNYVKAVSLIAIDEIHLLGEDRGPVLEVIVSRTNFISAHTENKLRIIGLSTALANASDIGNWLGIKEIGLYNFQSSVRPVPLEVHVSGYHGKHYCPRMAVMNKPTYQAIQQHSPTEPTLIFVSSRRQTRLTAQDLISYLCCGERHRAWIEKDFVIDNVLECIQDQNLKFTLAFGIGLHHAGLHEKDRKIVEELFLNKKIQVLIATATLAWGINLPAHLVVIKGTEYYDAKVNRYVDFPITDVMQMCGRAGRPQFDSKGIAVVLVQDIKKDFYKKFLHDPFPVESSLLSVLPEHMNAEIVAGTISTKQQCLDYITWTYFFRRLLQNPSFYALESVDGSTLNVYLSGLINLCLRQLSDAGCLTIDDDDRTVSPTVLGRIASYYYLNHKTILVFTRNLHPKIDMANIIQILCDAHEYEELPVRHNEDAMNKDLHSRCPYKNNEFSFDSPHTKANLLLQAHFSRLVLPCTDYSTDLKSVLDQAIRIIQAMIDVSADKGWLAPALLSMTLLQMILQANWHNKNPLLTLPYIEEIHLPMFRFTIGNTNEARKMQIDCLPRLIHLVSNKYEVLDYALRSDFDELQIKQIYHTLTHLPIIKVKADIVGWWDESNEKESRNLITAKRETERPHSDWQKVHADQEYVLKVQLQRISRYRKDAKAIAPKFSKQKSEGWFLILGNPETQELIAMKRIPFVSRMASHQLMFYTPQKEQGNINYKLYLISDSYLGLDQEYDILLNVITASFKSQCNSEMISDSSSDEET